MKWNRKFSFAVAITLLLAAIPVFGQIYRYYKPGSIWTVTTVRIAPGMDAAYLQYLDGAFKKDADAAVKNKFMKSYKILRSIDDDASWNMLLLREYDSLSAIEANEEKADVLSRQVTGEDDGKAMASYETRNKARQILGTKTMRELVIK